MGFNPRTPCGVRPSSPTATISLPLFQSTHSLRSATCEAYNSTSLSVVSIHALLAECDKSLLSAWRPPNCFNPRTPCGVRPFSSTATISHRRFQSTHSLRSATRKSLKRSASAYRFQSTHSLRSATQPTLYITTQQSKSYFAPTSLKRPSLHGYTF